MFPESLVYTEDHQWMEAESATRGRMGLTHYGQEALGDVVFIDLPSPGQRVEAGKPLAVVESLKAVVDFNAPAKGTVVCVNEALLYKPNKMNTDPYGDGWVVVVDFDDAQAVIQGMDAAAYERFVKGHV